MKALIILSIFLFGCQDNPTEQKEEEYVPDVKCTEEQKSDTVITTCVVIRVEKDK